MSQSSLAPRPGAAPYAQMVRAQAGMETRLMLRNGEQLLLAVVIPVIVLVGGVLAADRMGLDFSHPAVDVLTPGVVALAVMSTSFTSLAISTGFERRYGVLKRLGASPLPRSGLLLGKVLALLVIELLQLVVISGVGLMLGWQPDLSGLPAGLVMVAGGTFAFAGLGMLLAGVLRAEATLAAANLVYLLLMAAGAVVLPSSSYGSFATIARLLPSGALGDGLRAATLHGSLDLAAVAVLVVWGTVATLVTARTFRWE